MEVLLSKGRIVSTLAMTDALAKLLIEKGIITSTTSNFETAGQTAMLEYKGFKIDGSSIPMLMLR